MKKSWMLAMVLGLGVGCVWAQEESKTAQPALTGTAVESSAEPAAVAVSLKATLKTGTGIAEKEIDGENATFPVSVGKVYCWSLIEGAQEPVEIKHQWWHEGNLVVEVPLNVKYPRFRTWSYKTLTADLIGNWEVKVVDNQGQILGSLNFKVLADEQVAPEVKNEVEPKAEPKTEPQAEPKTE